MCLCVCMYVCMCICICMYVCIHMYTVLPRFTAPLYNTTPAYRHRIIQYNSISVYFCDMLFYRKHSVAWCFLNNQPTWACLVTCIHYILDFGVVKSKLNLLLYITEFLYSCRPIFFLVSYIAVMNLANCLTFGSVINDSISQNGFPVMVLLPPPPLSANSHMCLGYRSDDLLHTPPPVDEVPPDWLLLHKDCYVFSVFLIEWTNWSKHGFDIAKKIDTS